MTEVGRNSPQENSEARFQRWVTKNDRSEDARRRRFTFISGFVGLGLVTWLFWTW